MNESRKALLEADSSRIQVDISNKIFSNSTLESLNKNNFLDKVEKHTDMISRRLKNHRHPLSGMKALLPEMSEDFISSPDLLTQLQNSQSLNSRILEAWINNTLIDALSQNSLNTSPNNESKSPLVSYGIDRTRLIKSGLAKQEIDRLYRSLFVYSIGFYQLIKRILEHTNKQYSIVTGIWKVYAILLEYCCQLDYQMVITTLNIEKKEELEHLETDYMQQINNLETREKEMQDCIDFTKFQLQEVQKELKTQVGKREEAEDELIRRGAGHEEEVSMRLLFESRLNQMYAKFNDLEMRILALKSKTLELEREGKSRSEILGREHEKNAKLKQLKKNLEAEMKRTDEKYKQAEILNISLDKRITECYAQIEELNEQIGKFMIENSEALNNIAQKNIEIDELKFSLKVNVARAENIESMIMEYEREKELHIKRIKELEGTLALEVSENRYYKQEYVKMKKISKANNDDIEKQDGKIKVLEEDLGKVTTEKNILVININSMSTLINELKANLKDAQTKLEDKSKVHKKIEDKLSSQKTLLIEKEKEVKSIRTVLKTLKDEKEHAQNHEAELEATISDLRIKLQNSQNLYKSSKDSYDEKISNLTEIIDSEKKIRESWVSKYQELQKNYSNDTKEFITTHNKLNEAILKIKTLSASLDESNFYNEKIKDSHKGDIEEIKRLQNDNESYIKKIRLLQMIIESNEQDNWNMIEKMKKTYENDKEEFSQEINRAYMRIEEFCGQTLGFMYKISDLEYEKKDMAKKRILLENQIGENKSLYEKLLQDYEKKCMTIEEDRETLLKLYENIQVLNGTIKGLQGKVKKIKKELEDFKDQAPPEVRYKENPFEFLVQKIKELSEKLQFIERYKPEARNQSIQWESLDYGNNDDKQNYENYDPDEVINYENESNKISAQTDKRDHFYEVRKIVSPLDNPYIEHEDNKGISYQDLEFTDNLMPKYRSSTQGRIVHKSSLNSTSNKFGTDIRKKPSSRLEVRFESPEDQDGPKHQGLLSTKQFQEEEKITNFSLKSIYSRDLINPTTDLIEVPVKSSTRLPYIKGKSRIYHTNPLTPTPIPTFPSGDFKKILKQVESRKRKT